MYFHNARVASVGLGNADFSAKSGCGAVKERGISRGIPG